MRLAIIDLGTNSIRFDIHEMSANRKGEILHRRLYREKSMVRLGQNLFLSGKLNEESKRRTIKAIESFSQTMDALHVNKTLAFGTAAMRDASDAEQFLEDIKTETGIEFRIISGAEEAALIAKGILHNELNPPKGVFALVDIGGGSTEISICKGNKVLHSHSFNLGVAKLQQVFLKGHPPIKTAKADPILELRSYIKSIILPKILIERWPKASKIIGSSGSILALSKLIQKDKDANPKAFPKKELSKTVNILKTKSTAELLSLKGMEPKRVDLILAGAILLDEVVQLLGAKEVKPTEFSLRDGILEAEIERYSTKKARGVQFSLEEVERRVTHWGVDLPHVKNVQNHAEFLFDALKGLHKLKQEWRPYLSAAALLHDVGEIISHSQHAEHSEYIVKNANFVGMHEWEANLVAFLCRYHKEEKLLEKKNEKKIPYDKKDELRPVFLKLLALLQIADSCDRSHKGSLVLKKTRNTGRKIELRFASKSPCDLEVLRFEQKKALFEDLFKREISLVRG